MGRMLKFVLFALAVSNPALGARRLRGNVARDERSLTNTFPFNQKAGSEEHHGDHGDHHGPHGEASELVSRNQRTGRVSDAKADADADAEADADAGANPNPYFGLYGYPYGGYYGYPYHGYYGKRSTDA